MKNKLTVLLNVRNKAMLTPLVLVVRKPQLTLWIVAFYSFFSIIAHANDLPGATRNNDKAQLTNTQENTIKEHLSKNKITAHKLPLVYSVNDDVCKQAAELIENNKACRPFDNDDINCGRIIIDVDASKFWSTTKLQEIASNEYGYTGVYRAVDDAIHGNTIIYLQNFVTDRMPRITQTWKVDSSALDQLLKLPPGPISLDRRDQISELLPKETNSKEFANLLANGEKLSNEWSPVIITSNSVYLVKRECVGTWAFGAYYICNKEIKLEVVHLSQNENSVPYCQFEKPKSK